MTAATLGALLRARARERPDAPLLRFAGQQRSYAQVDADSERLARRLRERGVATGERVALMLPNGLAFPTAWLALAKLGAVAVPVNVGARGSDLEHVLRDSGARLAIVDPPLAERIPAVAPALEVAPWPVLEAELAAVPADPLPPLADPDPLLNLQYTSGTTGLPKACMLTHGYWLGLAERCGELLGLREDDVCLAAQPFSYMDPQWMTAAMIACGGALEILPRFSASTFWRSAADSRATVTYLVGTMPLLLLRQPEDPVERRHRLRLVLCSGIVPDLHAEFERRWAVPWREAYGMTETGLDLAVDRDDAASVGSGSIGRPVPGKQARIVDGDDRPAPDGTVGELVVRGGTTMRGYWNRPEDTARTIRDGWLHTGDLAVRRADGRFWIVGRLKDMIRRGGENVAAAEVEAVLATHPDVATAAVIGVPDPLRGEEVKAVVQRCRGATATAAELRSFAAERLAPFKVPRFWSLVDELPRTPSERVAKHQLPRTAADAWDARPELAR
ncbi:AMP-binding protein [Patulibacter defluvii]|uniref:AMP-binding protein n=1 Tax=Patulibacter defluvii TaxID=3095358 RepID=UPI002A75809B|nr:AMP-binding protein [Patulibacter sp. DM4]